MSPAPPQRYRHPSDAEDPYTAELRTKFMAAVDKLEPDVGKTLFDEDGPARTAFRALADALEETGQDEYWTLSVLLDRIEAEPLDNEPESAEDPTPQEAFREDWLNDVRQEEQDVYRLAVELQARLFEWAKPYNLHRDSWILDYAARLLQANRISEEGPSQAHPRKLGDRVPWLSYAGPAVPSPRPYHPEAETRDKYLEWIERYMDRVEWAANRSGWEEGREKRHKETHLRWLARYQVKREKQREIAEAEGVSLRNLEKAIEEMSRLIGLTRRSEV